VIGSNLVAGQGALKQAQKEGFHTMLLTNYLQGEAKEVAKVLAAILRQMASNNPPLARPACIILGGETTVTLQGNGQGGRNQEIALASIYDLAGINDIALITLATDGGDGSTDAAGAVVTGETFQRAQEAGLDPQIYLKNNDSYNFFKSLNDLVITGPTLTNVNDLACLF
jgi:hydroxypyruvate reductase